MAAPSDAGPAHTRSLDVVNALRTNGTGDPEEEVQALRRPRAIGWADVTNGPLCRTEQVKADRPTLTGPWTWRRGERVGLVGRRDGRVREHPFNATLAGR